MPITLVLGGARSGKSAYAQREAETATTHGGKLVMIATGQAMDGEMAERIARHQADRGPRWSTVEAPVDLAAAIADLTQKDIAVIDCLTLWLSNLLMRDADVAAESATLAVALKACNSTLWIVSNETGLGIVPDNALARRFRDESGRLHQQIAAVADRAFMVVAGLPLRLK
jgi:adenosylcobinamide kinase/adenosylcobinamide-phosphate guanylyltransferase